MGSEPMAKAQFDTLAGPEPHITRLVANQVMGWQANRRCGAWYVIDPAEVVEGVRRSWDPTYDYFETLEIEKRIRELGMESDYVLALAEQCGIKLHDSLAIFRLIHATPMERCKAALRMIDKASNGKPQNPQT
jgi:hypothetical protein